MPSNKTNAPSNTTSDQSSPSINQEQNITRRTVLRKLAVGSAALAGCSIIPQKWTAPIIEFGALPAHAITSGELEDVLEAVIAETSQQQADEAVAADEARPVQIQVQVQVNSVWFFTKPSCPVAAVAYGLTQQNLSLSIVAVPLAVHNQAPCLSKKHGDRDLSMLI